MTVTIPAPPKAGNYALYAGDGVLYWHNLYPVKPLRAAFYYPWFPAAWNQQGFNPFTNYNPSLGFYSSADLPTIYNHIEAMQYAHLDAGIVSWWGQGSQEDSVIPALLTSAATLGTGFSWCLYYEPEGVGDPTSAQIAADLSYIASQYGNHPNYLKINGRPVIFVYADANDGAGMASRWLAGNVNAQFYVVLKVFPGYQAVASDAQAWHQYAPAVAVDHQPGYSFTVSPGFYKKGEAAPRLVRDPAAFATNVAAMVASKEPLQLITTFNEWGEGTAVESAAEWATPSGYGTYLDILHNTLT